MDVARIVAVAVGAQPAELALPAGRERSPGRRVSGQPAQQRLGRRDQGRIDVELIRVGDGARARQEAERELRRQPESRQAVAATSRHRVAVGRLLHAPGGQLQEVASLFDRAAVDQILDLDRKRGQAALAVLERDAHQIGRPGVDGGRQHPAHAQPRQAELRQPDASGDEADHHAERQEVEVDARVDGGGAHEQRGPEEPPPFARRRLSALELGCGSHPGAGRRSMMSASTRSTSLRSASAPRRATRERPGARAPGPRATSDRRAGRSRDLRRARRRGRRCARRAPRAATHPAPGGANGASRARPPRCSRRARRTGARARRLPAARAPQPRTARVPGAPARLRDVRSTRAGCAARPRATGSRCGCAAGSDPSATRAAGRCRSAPRRSASPSPGRARRAGRSGRRPRPVLRSSPRADALCVRGGVRLISSASTRFANTGPGRNSNSPDFASRIDTPTTSEGSRSLVNCMRWNVPADRARQRARQRRLADAGDVLDEQVAARKQRDDRVSDRARLAAEDAPDVGLERRDEVRRRGDSLAWHGRGAHELPTITPPAQPLREGWPRRAKTFILETL